MKEQRFMLVVWNIEILSAEVASSILSEMVISLHIYKLGPSYIMEFAKFRSWFPNGA